MVQLYRASGLVSISIPLFVASLLLSLVDSLSVVSLVVTDGNNKLQAVLLALAALLTGGLFVYVIVACSRKI
jgi:membrane protein YqaA with SNARE-associated domain